VSVKKCVYLAYNLVSEEAALTVEGNSSMTVCGLLAALKQNICGLRFKEDHEVEKAARR
jgi:hypothetical protein